jgi:hypothetical protein
MFVIQLLTLLALLSVVLSFQPVVLNTTSTELGSSSLCVCTTVPCPVAGHNPLTEGGGAVITYFYTQHGEYPVVTSAEGTLTPKALAQGTGTTSCTQEYSRMLDDDGKKDCDAGHILAHHLGGLGNQPINIFPQDATLNRGAYAQFEGKIYDCLDTGGAKSAYLTWKFTYADTTRTKPDYVKYTATFDGGSCEDMSTNFNNQSN